MVGTSTGAMVFIAISIAINNLNSKVAVIAADSGERYLHNMFNNEWLKKNKISTECNVKNLISKALNTKIYSKSPLEVTNYKPELQNELK